MPNKSTAVTKAVETDIAVIVGVIEAIAAESVAPVSAIVSDAVLESAVADATLTEATREAYADQPAGTTVDTTAEVAAPVAKVKAPKVAKTPKVKAEPKPRLTFAKPAAKIAHVLGEKLGDTLVLDTSDALLDAPALKAKQDATLVAIDGLAKKVGEKAVQLFQWVNKGGTLNEVMARALKVLAVDGAITSGDKGTLQADLSTKYSLGTARSQANQVFCLFPVLGVTKKDGKGKQVLNADSVIFAKYQASVA